MRLNIPLIRQPDKISCGPTALRMVLKYFGLNVSIAQLSKLAKTTERSGTSRENMVKTLRALGLTTIAEHGASIDNIRALLEKKIPVIVNYQDSTMTEGHYGIMIGFENGKFVLNDPFESKPVIIEPKVFAKRWYGYHKTQFAHWMLAVTNNK